MEEFFLGIGQRSGRKRLACDKIEDVRLTGCRGQILGWTGMIRVDGVTKSWMGRPAKIPKAEQRSAQNLPTRSQFEINVDDKVTVHVTFLDPITPKVFHLIITSLLDPDKMSKGPEAPIAGLLLHGSQCVV